MKKVLVIGAGAWGTALAQLLSKNCEEVLLSANKPEIVAEINKKNCNEKFLPGIKLSKKITAILNFDKEISAADFVFIVTPSSAISSIFAQIANNKFKKSCRFVICSKGIETNSLQLLGDLFEKVTTSKNYAILSGPNFASEVAQGLPSITTLACKDKKLFNDIAKILNNESFCAQHSREPRSIEIFGTTKNIIAIGCGIIDELGLGVNAKAALVMKGISETQLLCKKFKTSSDVANAAGFGDIFLTCSSHKSRNNWLGTELAKGKPFKEIATKSGKTFEGAASAKAIAAIAKKSKLRLELFEAINEILSKKFDKKQIQTKITKAILTR
jgi:glycerol-3-phosphate dehydrogenase (NAD(P)+)